MSWQSSLSSSSTYSHHPHHHHPHHHPLIIIIIITTILILIITSIIILSPIGPHEDVEYEEDTEEDAWVEEGREESALLPLLALSVIDRFRDIDR
jgi:hypothetical protein